ncbi:MAG: glycoside hydrolase family 9 protein, partial [Saprospiraceae bacterium]|nr:glycoside hydrolase family 9 protein [Saprospiraceae bacterium]
ADQLRAAAVAAWNWADSHPGAEFYNSGIVAAGENQTDAYETQMRKLGAACFLFAATGSDIYRQAGINLYQQAHLILWSYAYLFEPHTQEVLMYFSNLPGVPANVKNNIQNTYSNSIQNGNADNLPAFLNQADAYRAFVRDDNYTWGSNEFKAHQGNMFFLMNELGLNAVNQTNYRNAGSGFLHYLHGVNPTGYCYLSNMNGRGASFSIPSLYHGWFNDGTIWDEVGVSTHGPAPGFMPGGPNPYFHPDGSCNCVISPPENQPIQKSFKSWNTGWPQNSWELSEVAIYTQAAYLRLLSNVLAGKSNPPQCGGVSSTLDVLSLHALAIFPNPADQTLVIKSPDEPVVCRIFRSTGELVERLHLKAGESVSFQTADLPVGPYFLNWQSTKGEKRGNFTFQVVH